MSMGDAVALMDYWADYPPTHVILRAVHRERSPRAVHKSRSPTDSARRMESVSDEPFNEAETMQQILEAQQMAGGALGPQREMPEHLKNLADYAEEMISKMNVN